MRLYGSYTSPYVRRLRVLMQDIEHDFELVNIFEENDRVKLSRINPSMKIPMLEDEGNYIFDSGVIYRYLAQKCGLAILSWEEENLLTSINSITDSLVQLFILNKSDIANLNDSVYYKMQQERIDIAFSQLNEQAKQAAFEQWRYPAMCLFCLLDWLVFRQLHNISNCQTLLELHAKWSTKDICKITDPRDLA